MNKVATLIIAGLIIVIALLLLFWPDDPEPVNTQPWKDSLAKKELQLRDLRVKETELKEEIKSLDSMYDAETQAYKGRISRLNRKLSEIDTKNATVPELDSIVNALYNDAP